MYTLVITSCIFTASNLSAFSFLLIVSPILIFRAWLKPTDVNKKQDYEKFCLSTDAVVMKISRIKNK